ncbi:MAG TPA: hypothetical protein VGD65_20410 [Chryseosolibacter sp.]
MKNDRNTVVKVLLGSLAILLLVYFTLGRNNEKRFQWSESYRSNSEQPYGTLFIQKLLSEYRPGQKLIINDKQPLHVFLDSAKFKKKTDYVFIGQGIYLDEEDVDALLNFISNGNDAFVASYNLPFDLVDPMFVSDCGKQIFLAMEDTLSANMNFYNRALAKPKGYKFVYRFGKKDQPYFWNSLNPEIFCDSTKSITPLGFIAPDKVNFFRLQYGKGNLYVHTNPLAFTNYFLTKQDKAEYASSVFSHLKADEIIWDEFSKSKFTPSNNAPEVSPIAYILEQESLRYAWWLILGAALLYTIFTAKRKQRIIPVLEEKANTSLEFVNLISALHFQNGNHHDIGRKKMKYFFYFIKSKYNMHLQALTEAALNRLAEKSKVGLDDLKTIAVEFNHIENQSYYNEHRLVDLHNALEKFYKTCK